MCLMVYLATEHEQPLVDTPDLRVEAVTPDRQAVVQWFSLPHVRFVGAHTGCSCGFPSFIADTPVPYYDGLFRHADSRDADLRSVRALLALVRAHTGVGGVVQLYPIADGDEGRRPLGVIDAHVDELRPEVFFFTEGFLYRVWPPSTS